MFVGIMFVLKVLMFTFCLGVSLCIIVYVPLMIYVVPYGIWLGGSKAKRQYPHLANCKSFWLTVRRATKLYKSWITHKDPTF
ncbi:hypothetical protein EDD78_10684 [Harryflintia acetispora]|uniref:Uncharacterized protein n=1 Tax=Harryflintia acetispora TaxID=1849041 RepID=A0A9X8UJ07_9FIRM|nr:hypothetical protein EDD78_10684 [Harryflintia acetispora]